MQNSNLNSVISSVIVLLALATYGVSCSDNKTESANMELDSSTVTTMPDTTELIQPADTSTAGIPADTSKKINATTKKKGKVSVEIMPVIKNPKIKMDKSGVYAYPDVAASYPGGQSALDAYITSHITYPQAALDYNKEGRIGVGFIVDENGNLSDVHVMGRKLGEGLDEEAVRVVSSMNNWIPGTVKGKAVKSKVNLPITFKIEEQ